MFALHIMPLPTTTTRQRLFRTNRLVHQIEWKSFADQLDTLRELKDFLTVDGVLQKVCGGNDVHPRPQHSKPLVMAVFAFFVKAAVV